VLETILPPEYNRPACQKVLVNKRAPVDLMSARCRELLIKFGRLLCAVSSGEGSDAGGLTDATV
jgi:hypothetical protein